MPSTDPRGDYGKEALKLVNLDRQLAAGVSAAVKAYTSRRRATARTFRMLLFAAELDAALEKTRVARGSSPASR